MHETSQIAAQLADSLGQMAIWIPLLPIISCFTIFICQMVLPKTVRDNGTYQTLMKLVSVLGIGLAGVVATIIFANFWAHNLPTQDGSQIARHLLFDSKDWFSIGEHHIKIGILLDNMSSTVVFMVTWVACLIQIFSWGYMKGEDHIVRYFCYHSLFVASMLGMVLSDNFLTFLISWELMGLCSYLLIGFFWRKKSANNAQKKAFLTTRIGDLGFFLGVFVILGIWMNTLQPISFQFSDFADLIKQYGVDTTSFWQVIKGGPREVTGIPMYLLTAAALLLFMGTVGKSAQFPLHIWLPDAMEGPTPVSALIHAATMVAAGVYLVARVYFVFDPLGTGYSPALVVVAMIGGFTAFMAATIGVTQYDIKRVLAYSTISQLGYMVMGLGVGAMTAGVFHMITHAYFKSLLFLGSGAVIYGCHHVQDMRYMGGLRKYMPITFVVFLVGTLALMGFPGTAGFFSKDMILEHAFMVGFAHPEMFIAFGFGIFGAVLTCFYMTRQIFMVFFGENRRELIPEADRHGHSVEHMTPKESPAVMLVPLVILAVFALFFGWPVKYGHQDLFNSSLYSVSAHGSEPSAAVQPVETKAMAQGGEHTQSERSQIVRDKSDMFESMAKRAESGSEAHKTESEGGEESGLIWIPQLLALLAVALGIFSGYRVFFLEKGRQMKDSWKKQYPKLYDIVYNKYYCDEYIQVYIVNKLLVFNMFLRAVDMYVIDGFVNGVATITVLFTKVTRWFDQGVVDGLVNGVASAVNWISRTVRYLQSGYVQNYYMLISVTVLVYLFLEGKTTLLNISDIFHQFIKAFTLK